MSCCVHKGVGSVDGVSKKTVTHESFENKN